MIVELKTFEDMTPQEQQQHLLDILTDGDDVATEELEELRKLFLKRHRTKSDRRTYLTCRELGELVGRSEDTIRQMFINEKQGVLKRTTSGRNRKSYTTLQISRTAAKRKFPDLNI